MPIANSMTSEEKAQAEQILRETFPRRISQYHITNRPLSRSDEDGEHYVLIENQHSAKRYVIGCYSTKVEAHRIERMAEHLLGQSKNHSRMKRAEAIRKKSGNLAPSLAEYPVHDIKKLRQQIRAEKPEIPNLWAKSKAPKRLETFRVKPISGWVKSGYHWNPQTEEVTPTIISGSEHVIRLDLTRAMEIFERAALWRALAIDTTVQQSFNAVSDTLEITRYFKSQTDPKAYGQMMQTKNQLIDAVTAAQNELLMDYSDVKAQPWVAPFIAKRWHRKNLIIGTLVQRLIAQAEKFSANITQCDWEKAVRQSEIQAIESLNTELFISPRGTTH